MYNQTDLNNLTEHIDLAGTNVPWSGDASSLYKFYVYFPYKNFIPTVTDLDSVVNMT